MSRIIQSTDCLVDYIFENYSIKITSINQKSIHIHSLLFGVDYGIDPQVQKKNQNFTSTWYVFTRYLLNLTLFAFSISGIKYSYRFAQFHRMLHSLVFLVFLLENKTATSKFDNTRAAEKVNIYIISNIMFFKVF